MGTSQPRLGGLAPSPGLGLGWTRVAEAVSQQMPATDVSRIWVFAPMRVEGREWGTAVIARLRAGGRLLVSTARYMLVLRGKQKGQGKVEVEEVAECPTDVVLDVVRRVQERAGEAEPPVEIAPSLWFGDGDEGDEPAPEG